MVNPFLDSKDIKSQMDYLKDQLQSRNSDGRATLSRLSQILHEGFQVSAPYPTRLAGVQDCAEHLFQTLVYRSEQAQPTEHPTYPRLAQTLREVAFEFDRAAVVQELGDRQISNVRVNLGVSLKLGNANLLWRIAALNTKHDDQVARAKATAMDIIKIKGLSEYDGFEHSVAVQRPIKISSYFDEATRWIGEQAKFVTFSGVEMLSVAIRDSLFSAA
jgi:hypothetical protein